MRIIATLLSVIVSCLLSASLSAKTINYYVIANQAQPFQIEESGEKQSGMVTDIVRKVFENSDYEIVYHTYPFNRMIATLEAGGEPNWITFGSPNWGKVQAENLSDKPIYTVKHTLVTSKRNAFEFNGMESMKGKGVVLLLGFDYPDLLPYIENGTVEDIRVKDYQAAFRVVQRTPGDTAFVEMASRVKYNMKKLGLNPQDFITQPFSTVIPDYSIYLAFSHQMEPEIQDFINQRLEQMRVSGELDAIIANYI